MANCYSCGKAHEDSMSVYCQSCKFTPTTAEPKQCSVCKRGINWRRIEWGEKHGYTITRCKTCSDKAKEAHAKAQADVDEQYRKNPNFRTLAS